MDVVFDAAYSYFCEMMNNAKENGYDLSSWDNHQIARDLYEFDGEAAKIGIKLLVRCAEKWKESLKD